MVGLSLLHDLSTGKAHARSPSIIYPETSYIQRGTDSWTVPNISRISAHWPPNFDVMEGLAGFVRLADQSIFS